MVRLVIDYLVVVVLQHHVRRLPSQVLAVYVDGALRRLLLLMLGLLGERGDNLLDLLLLVVDHGLFLADNSLKAISHQGLHCYLI